MSHSPSPPALYPHSSFPSFLLCYQPFLQGKDPWNFVWLVVGLLVSGKIALFPEESHTSPSRRNCLFMWWNQPWHWALPHCVGFSCGWYRKYCILVCPAPCSSFFSKFFFSLPLLWRDFCGKRKWNRWLQQVSVLWAAGPSENWGCLSLCWAGAPCEGTGADDWPGSILGQRTGSCFWLLSHIFLLDCFRELFIAFSTRSGWEYKNCVLELSLRPCAAPVWVMGNITLVFQGCCENMNPTISTMTLLNLWVRLSPGLPQWLLLRGSRVMSWPWKNLCRSWSCRFIWDPWSPSLLLPGHFFVT